MTCHTSWANASCVGGMFSMSMPFWLNSTSLSPLTLLSELPRSYMMTINLSIMGRTFMTLSVVDILDSVHRADVASSYAVQAVRFPFPANDEVTSYPVKAWNTGTPPQCVQVYTPARYLRSASSYTLVQNKSRTAAGDCTIVHAAATVWNALPVSVTYKDPLLSFKVALKTRFCALPYMWLYLNNVIICYLKM